MVETLTSNYFDTLESFLKVYGTKCEKGDSFICQKIELKNRVKTKNDDLESQGNNK